MRLFSNIRGLTIRQRRRQRQREDSESNRASYVMLAFPPKLRLRILRARTLTTAIDVNESFFSKLCLSFVTPFSWLMLPVWLTLKNSCYSTIYTSLKIRIYPTQATSASTSTRWQIMNVKLSLDFTRMTSTTWLMYSLYRIESFATMV